MLNDNASVVPANTLSDILVHLGEFGLEVRQQSVQQFRDSPLLLGQPPLKHIQQAARDKHISDEDGGGGRCVIAACTLSTCQLGLLLQL